MGCRTVIFSLLAVALALALSPSAFAHDVWLTTELAQNGVFRAVIHHGHPGDRKPPDADKLFELRCIDQDGRSTSLISGISAGMRDGNPVLITRPIQPEAPGVLVLAAQYDNGFWVKTDEGYRNTSKAQYRTASDSLHSMKFAKALVSNGTAPAESYVRLVGHRLELVPIDNPFSLKPGDKLHVRVLFEEKPLEGVGVEIGDGVTPIKEKDILRHLTNQEGIAELPISRLGLQVIAVDHKAASRHPDLADKEFLVATFSFVLSLQ